MAPRPAGRTGGRPGMRRFVLVLILFGTVAAHAPAAFAAQQPTGATAVALDGQVQLAWQPVIGASAYNVYRGLSPTTVTTAITPVGGVAATGFTDTTAVNGTTYYYAVKPIVGGAETGDSSLTFASTPRARTCSTGNAIVLENCFPGDTTWPLGASAGNGIEGFATAQSINKGESLNVKVNTSAATTFHIEVYRTGY